MTRTTNARIAGITFLVYIAAGIASMILFARATSGTGVTAQLASVAQHATNLRLTLLLTPVMNLSAIVLGVTLYAITRAQDRDLALLALACRLAEGIHGMDVSPTVGLLWLGTAPQGTAPDAVTTLTLGTFFLRPGGFEMSATLFAVGSTIFSWLLLRGRMIPIPLAWTGVLASAILVVCLPLLLAGWLRGPITSLMWLPMLLFELTLAVWLIVRGVAAPPEARPAS